MLNKYRYKNKLRYSLRKKEDLLIWEKEKINKFKTQYKVKKYKNTSLNWKGKLFWKNRNINEIIYKSACKYYKELTNNFWKEKRGYSDWMYNPIQVYRKRAFLTKLSNRENFIDNVLLCIKKKDSLAYIKNSLFYLLERNCGFNKVLDILNFSWLYDVSGVNELNIMEKFNLLSLEFFYKGFLKKGNKRICERRFLELLSMLKLKFKKASLQIMYFFIKNLKPLVGFRRQRLGKRKNKRNKLRFSYKLYYHSYRWKSLLFKRFCFNSPYYQKNTKYVTVLDLYKGLLLSIKSKGPIAKCLGMYYTLIGRRTPYAQRQKKKKKSKSRSIRI